MLQFLLGLITVFSAQTAIGGRSHAKECERLSPVVLEAQHFGIVGDGRTDDGPAIQRAVTELRKQERPAVLQFEPGKTYRVETVDDIRLFRLDNMQDVTIDGGGSTFVLNGDVRFALITRSANVCLKNFSLDYDPLPFVDGLIVAKNAEERYVDVRVFDEFKMPPLGGPTREGGEQAYFGMLWTDGPHSLIGHHFYVLDMQQTPSSDDSARTVRVFTDFPQFDRIEVNEHAISLPVRGVAHRCMDGATIRIADCEDVVVENADIWSAPWFVFQVFRNRGTLTFRDIDIRPKPGANRRTSSWRDGFHVKGNRASLRFESCHLEGMNDDAFNISTHMSRVVKVVSPTRIEVQQVYPLEIVPFEPGDSVTFYDKSNERLLGSTTALACDGVQTTEHLANGRRRAPVLALHLTEPIDGLQVGDRLWNDTSANPDTVIRDCTIFKSCRFQSPVTIEDCNITAFAWFHSENVEGPIPSRVVIRNSTLRLGRGNPLLAASFDGRIAQLNDAPAGSGAPALKHVLLEGNTIDGQVRFARIEELTLRGNTFVLPRSKLRFSQCERVLLRDNRLGAELIQNRSQLAIQDDATRAAIEIDNRVAP